MEEGLSTENLSKIACLLDVQGFIINNIFYPRELAILNNTISRSFNIDTELFSLSNIQKGAANYQTHAIHGLTLRPEEGTFNITTKNFKDILFILVKTLTSRDQPLVGIKNHQLKPILQSLGIDYIDLEKGDVIVPSIESLDSLNPLGKWVCENHTECDQGNRKCALRKCFNIWSWLEMQKEKLRQIKLISEHSSTFKFFN